MWALAGVLGCTITSTTNADVLRVPGIFTAVADRVEGSAVTVLDFELPQLRQGEGLEVVTATINWDHSGLTEHKAVRYRVFNSTEQGLEVLHLGATLETLLDGEPSSSGVFYPQDYRRIGKGQLSLDVLPQVRGIVELHESHLQVLVATEDMSPEVLGSAASSVPILVVRYGFLGEMKTALSHPD
jgi:hypothetical protein